MSKLPQHIEERFDTVFADNMYEFGEGDGFRKQVKSFIATILEEATKEAKIDGFMQGSASRDEEIAILRYNAYGESIHPHSKDDVINLIKEDEKNNL